jgi:hypothetical protein
MRLWALATAAGLVFAQLAMAAFAPPAHTPAMARAMAEAMPCHEPDPAVQHLCIKKNCQEDAQKNDRPSCAVAALPTLDGLRVDPPRDPDPIPATVPESVLARATSPPPEVLFSRRLE